MGPTKIRTHIGRKDTTEFSVENNFHDVKKARVIELGIKGGKIVKSVRQLHIQAIKTLGSITSISCISKPWNNKPTNDIFHILDIRRTQKE